MDKFLKSKSKYISKLLRHDPEDLEMSKDGYVKVSALLKKVGISMETLEQICEENDKKRFEFDKHKQRIKARQGHSLKDIEVELTECTYDTVPEFLYHVPGPNAINDILKTGLKKMNRIHVHMSANLKMIEERAKMLYKRDSNLPVITIYAKDLIRDQKIFVSNNNVYLSDDIATKYLKVSYDVI